MNTAWSIALIVAVYTQSVYCSYYHGPTAKPVVLHNGYLADTHEVAAAKNAHLATLGQQHSYGYEGSYGEEHSGSHGDIRYHGPTAIPHVLHDGHIADTHEVAAAKAEHFAAVAKQSHYGGDYGYGGSYGYGHGQEYSGSYGSHHGDFRYHGPTAIPHVLHDGHIADTHEVAAAKAEHFATVAKAKAHGGYGDHYSGSYATGYGNYHHVAPYHGPLAKPVVLKSGYLADTHEVAAAREHHLKALHGANRYHHQ